MLREVAEAIIKAADDIGLDGFELRESYRGRGCVVPVPAVTYECDSYFMAAVALAAQQTDEPDRFVGEMRHLAFDSMGLGKVAY